MFDTTLRDGEQSPGIALAPDEKVEIAEQLERLGVDVIEAGFAISSPGDFEGVRAVADSAERATVASLCRTKTEDIFKHHRMDVLVVERASLPTSTPVIATAWHNRLLCSGADEFRLEEFVQRFNNEGPEQIPHDVVPGGRDPRT